MYDYYEFFNSITSASNSSDFYSAIRNYLNDSALRWWHSLQENERQAIILLDFDPSVITTMTFFGGNPNFSSNYLDVLNVILNKINLLVNEELNNWDYTVSTIVNYAREQARTEQRMREKAIAITREMELTAGLDELEALLIKNNKTVRDMKTCKKNKVKEMRKMFLANALYYLRENYNKEEDE